MEAKISYYLEKKCDNNNKYFVKLYDEFEFGENYCMVYEKLGLSLYDFLKKNKFRGSLE